MTERPAWDAMPIDTPRFWGVPDDPAVRNAPGPIRAWKNGYWQGSHFVALMVHQVYLADARAECYGHHLSLPGEGRHQAPQLRCGCGFYAFKTAKSPLDVALADARSLPSPLASVLVFEVDLSGIVIGHERGYRAERQQIITVYAPPAMYGKNALRLDRAERIEQVAHVPVRPLSMLADAYAEGRA